MKAVMISIKPKWCELIAKGQKTIEVRKTKPKLEPPFKCYIYKTVNGQTNTIDILENNLGKVIGEFVCDRVSEYHYVEGNEVGEMIYDISTADGEATCLDLSELHKYGNGKTLYGWHISDLLIYDRPKKLNKFRKAGALSYDDWRL